jgi:hypothetical protein
MFELRAAVKATARKVDWAERHVNRTAVAELLFVQQHATDELIEVL